MSAKEASESDPGMGHLGQTHSALGSTGVGADIQKHLPAVSLDQ